jgi:hypothetical protein
LDWLPAGVAGGGGSPGFVVVLFIGMNGSSRYLKKKKHDPVETKSPK